MPNRTPGNFIQDQVVAANASAAVNNNISVAGKRGILGADPVVTTDLVPLFGFPKLSLYVPYALDAFGSGNAFLEWARGAGFSVGFGQTTSTALPAPTTATVSDNDLVWTLTFNGVPTDFQPMLGITLSGSIDQDGEAGQIQSATVNDDGNAVLVVTVVDDTVTFNTTDVISVTYSNLDIATPDPTKTEQVCMQLWALFEELSTVKSQLKKSVTDFPRVYLTLFATTDTTYSENTAPITLTIPNATSVVISTGAVLLGWTGANQPTGWGLLPDTAVGNIVITGDPTAGDSATGTLFSKGSGDPEGLGWTYYMILTNVVGTFVTTAGTVYTAVKDGSQDFGTMTAATVAKFYLGNHDANPSNSSLNTQFKNIVDKKNNYYTVQQNDGVGALGLIGVSSVAKNAYQTLWQANDRRLVIPFFPVESQPLATVQNYSIISTNAAAFTTACLALNAKPYNPTNNIVSSTLLPQSSNFYRVTKGVQGDSENILKMGYTPLYTTKQNTIATVRVVTTELTYPGTQTVDNEFFPASTQQILLAFNEDVIAYLNQPQFQNVRKTDTVKDSIWAGVYSMAFAYQTGGMFANVPKMKSLFTVVDNPDQVDSWIVNIPAQVVPELNNLYINVNVYSFTIQF